MRDLVSTSRVIGTPSQPHSGEMIYFCFRRNKSTTPNMIEESFCKLWVGYNTLIPSIFLSTSRGWEIFLESQQPNTLIGFHYAGCWLEHYTVEANVTMCVLCRLPKQKEEVHQRDLLSGAVIRISQVTDSHQASHCIETCQASSFTGLSFSRHSKGEKGWRLFYSQNSGDPKVHIQFIFHSFGPHTERGNESWCIFNENKADFQNPFWNTPAPYMETHIDGGCGFVLKGLTAASTGCRYWQRRCSWSCWQDRAPAPWQLLRPLQPRLSLQCVATAEPQRPQQSQRTPTKQ